MFMAAAHREMMIGEAATAKGYGFTVPEGAGKIDWKGLKERRDKYVAKLNTNYTAGWKKEGVEVIEGFASFTDAQTVSVQCNDGTTRVLKGQHILVACGGLPSEPDIPGVEHAINSDGFFELEEQPKKVAVVGAGYIAVEMAGILHALGSETHLFFRGDTVLRRGFDPFIVQTLMEAMEHHGPVLHRTSTPARISKQDDGRLTYVATEGPMGEEAILKDFDCILLAIGRKPVSDRLGLQNTGVELNKSGHIVVDAFENTNVPGIYAIGDVTSTGYELTPVAIAAGRRLADRLFLKEGRARIAYELIATVVFSHPPIGCIGLTEPQAKAEFGEENIKVKQSRFASMLYAFNDDDKKVKTALKLVLKLPEERIVGLHCIGPSSDEMMQGFAVAVRMGATRADFEASVAIHPTIAEEFVTFGGWGQQQQGDKVSALLPPYLS
ncbi:Glutathione reductase (GR) (GRase) [Durusdinium trenchii]